MRLSRRQKKSLLVKAGFLNSLGEFRLSYRVANGIERIGKLAHRIKRAKGECVHELALCTEFGSLEIMPVFGGISNRQRCFPPVTELKFSVGLQNFQVRGSSTHAPSTNRARCVNDSVGGSRSVTSLRASASSPAMRTLDNR